MLYLCVPAQNNMPKVIPDPFMESLQCLVERRCKARSRLLDADMNTENIIKSVQSGDLERQDSGFKEMTRFMASLAEEAVKAMCESTSPVVVAENIFRVAYSFRPPLEKLFSVTPSHELKSISASLLVQMGSRIGIEHLLHTIRTGADYDTLAATSLAKARIEGAVPALIEKLESLQPAFYSKRENAPTVNTFLAALKQLGGKLPAHLRERFTASDVTPDLSRFVE
jgi:hypothetical protein